MSAHFSHHARCLVPFMDAPQTTSRYSPLTIVRWLCLGLGGALALVASASAAASSQGAVQWVAFAVAGLLVLIGLAARVMGARATLACCGVVLPVLALFAWSPAGFVFFGWSYVYGHRPLGIHMSDQRLCYRHIPGATTKHEDVEFSVRYTIDASGNRVTPTPAAPLGNVTMLGCSFTFGHGVADHQTFPHVLGKEHWPRYKVQNRGVMGWGTGHALVALEEELEKEELPSQVIFGWMGDHLTRGYSEQYCLTMTSPSRLRLLQRAGEELDEANEGVVPGFLLMRQMYRRCKEKGVAFLVVILTARNLIPLADQEKVARARKDYRTLVGLLKKHGVPLLDLDEVAKDMYFPQDKHPNAGWHEAIARALAREPRLAHLGK